MYSILQGVFKDPQGEVTFLKKILGKAVTLLPPPPLVDASVVKYSQTPSVISHRVIKAVKLNMHIGSIYAAYTFATHIRVGYNEKKCYAIPQ